MALAPGACSQWRHGLPLLSMGHALLRTRALLDLKHLLARRPDAQHSLALAHLNLFASQVKGTRQSIEHAIVGDIAIPGHFALFGGEAFPGKGFWQGQQLLLGQTLHGPYMGGTMHTGVDALAPGVRLAIEIIQIREGDPCP